MRIAGFLLATGCLIAPAVAAQRVPADRWRLGFGLGTGVGGGVGGPGLSSEGFAGFLELGASRGSQRLALRYAGVAGPFGGSGVWDLAVLYGVGRRGGGSPRGSAGVGVALTKVEDSRVTLGLPFSFRVLFRLGKGVGLGAHGMANLNRHNGYAAATLAFYFGELP